MICVSAVGTGRYANLQVANSGDDRSKVSRRSWSKGICRKSISEGDNRELIGRRHKASAATFCSPEIHRISLVNFETKSKWRVARRILVRLRTQCESKRTVIGVDHKLPAL